MEILEVLQNEDSTIEDLILACSALVPDHQMST